MTLLDPYRGYRNGVLAAAPELLDAQAEASREQIPRGWQRGGQRKQVCGSRGLPVPARSEKGRQAPGARPAAEAASGAAGALSVRGVRCPRPGRRWAPACGWLRSAGRRWPWRAARWWLSGPGPACGAPSRCPPAPPPPLPPPIRYRGRVGAEGEAAGSGNAGGASRRGSAASGRRHLDSGSPWQCPGPRRGSGRAGTALHASLPPVPAAG